MSSEAQPVAEADHEGTADAERFRVPRGDDLRRLREAADLTTEEVAAAVGVSPSAVRGWEDGRDPRVENLRALLQVLRNPPENIDVEGEDGEDDEDTVDVPPAEELPDLIDPEFLEVHGTTDVAEALARAEEAASETEALARCPSCLSVRWWPKSDRSRRQSHAVDTAYRCTNCNEHFDERSPPEAEVDHAIDTLFRLEETDVCCACGDTAQLYAYDSTTSTGGYVCFDHLADLLAGGEVE